MHSKLKKCSNSKYPLLIKQIKQLQIANEKNKKSIVNKLIMESDISAYQLIQSQILFPLHTYNLKLDNVIDSQRADKVNDLFIYYYTKISNLYHIIYPQIISVCFPTENIDDYIVFPVNKQEENYEIINKKCVVFTSNHLVDKNKIVSYFIIPFINKYVRFKKDKDQKSINLIIRGIIDNLLKNIIVVEFHDLEELLIKIGRLDQMLRSVAKDSALIIIDGLNTVTELRFNFVLGIDNGYERKIDINFQSNDKNSDDDKESPSQSQNINNSQNQNDDINLSINKSENKNKDENTDEIKDSDDDENSQTEKDFLKRINEIIMENYKFYNFNLIFTFFDYDNDFLNNNNDTVPTKIRKVVYEVSDGLMFAFKAICTNEVFEKYYEINKYTFYIIEAENKFVKAHTEFFGILSTQNGKDYSFSAFAKIINQWDIQEIFKINKILPVG